jgi:hypothetical protein
MRKVNARKIYLKHYGTIPVGNDRRPYEVHHVDGNPENNDIGNLVAISIQDHYATHYAQGDWAACVRIAAKLKLPQEVLSELSRKNATKVNARTIADGTHNFLGANNHVHAKIKAGTYHLLGPAQNLARVAKGTHPSQIKVSCVYCQTTVDAANFVRYHGNNCVKIKPRTKYTCSYCGIKAAKHMIVRYHENNCKEKIS